MKSKSEFRRLIIMAPEKVWNYIEKQQAEVQRLQAIVKDLPDHSDLDAAVFQINIAKKAFSRTLEALEYMKLWAKQSTDGLTAKQIADAMVRMCDDAEQAIKEIKEAIWKRK